LHTRVDPGYKTPTIEFTEEDDPKSNIQKAAIFLTEHFKRLRDRSPEEKALEEGRKVLQATLLTHELKQIVLSHVLISQNRLVIMQQDLMSGINSITEIDLSNPSDIPDDVSRYLGMVEFNFLSEMQQLSHFKDELAPEYKERMKDIVNDFLGK
jgi:hypothetical protein